MTQKSPLIVTLSETNTNKCLNWEGPCIPYELHQGLTVSFLTQVPKGSCNKVSLLVSIVYRWTNANWLMSNTLCLMGNRFYLLPKVMLIRGSIKDVSWLSQSGNEGNLITSPQVTWIRIRTEVGWDKARIWKRCLFLHLRKLNEATE